MADERLLPSGAGVDAERVAAETDVAWPLLDPSAISEIAAFGSEIAVEAGQMLYRAGGEPPNFFVVVDGEVEIVRFDRLLDPAHDRQGALLRHEHFAFDADRDRDLERPKNIATVRRTDGVALDHA